MQRLIILAAWIAALLRRGASAAGAPSSPDAPLIATPEGWMCERCYADAK